MFRHYKDYKIEQFLNGYDNSQSMLCSDWLESNRQSQSQSAIASVIKP